MLFDNISEFYSQIPETYLFITYVPRVRNKDIYIYYIYANLYALTKSTLMAHIVDNMARIVLFGVNLSYPSMITNPGESISCVLQHFGMAGIIISANRVNALS